jgi:hypothetical protein
VAFELQKEKAKDFYAKLGCPHFKHFKYDDDEGFDLVKLARGKLHIYKNINHHKTHFFIIIGRGLRQVVIPPAC